MPAINVARTDTFEQQRVKINQIGSTLFSLTTGGSDLAAGNLKLGDGTRLAPSLSFASDTTLGLYKPSQNTIGFVSGTKKIFDISDSGLFLFKDFTVQKKILNTNGIQVTNFGSNYDPGIYTNISLIGGTGIGATSSINVGSFRGSVTNQGSNYTPGTYNLVPTTTSGAGSQSSVSFSVDGITGSVLNSGTGYPPGIFIGVPLTEGSGTGAIADVTITGSSTITGSITSPGSNYIDGTYSSINLLNIATSTFAVTTTPNPGTPPPTQVYQINGSTQQTLNLIRGNTYKFDMSDSSVAGHPLIFETNLDASLNSNYYTVITKGESGSPGACVYLIIDVSAPLETIKYDCSNHNNMGGSINITSGSIGNYGSLLTASVTFVSGSATNIVISDAGQKHKIGDSFELYFGDVGGTGSGFTYTINSIIHNGSVQNIVFSSIGLNYISNDVLSFSNSSVGGFGSGFQYRISSQPGKVRNLQFITKGTGYSVNDTLSFSSTTISNVSTTLRGERSNVSTILNSSSPIITVSSTDGIAAGMTVINNGISDIGFISPNTTVLSVDSLTQLTLSANPSSSGSSTLLFRSVGNLNQISVPSTSGILVGSNVVKISGSGVLGSNTTITAIDSSTNTLTLSSDPILAGSVILDFPKPYGNPTTNFEYTVNALGSIDFVSIIDGGNGYSDGDVLTVNPRDLTQPISKNVTVIDNLQKITFIQTIASSYFSVGDNIQFTPPGGGALPILGEIYQVKTSGSNLDYLVIERIYGSLGLSTGDSIVKEGQSTSFTVDTTETISRFFIDGLINPNLTLYVGDTYQFNISDSSNSGHNFSLSQFKDGIWSPSYIQNVLTILSDSSYQISVTDTTGILPGMEVSSVVGSGSGVLSISTKVASVLNSTTIVLDKIPVISGPIQLEFRGVEYLNGVEKSSSYIKISVTEETPNLYYYCSINPDEGGEDLEEATITIDPINPKTFGSNLAIFVNAVDSTDIIRGQVSSGEFTAESFAGSSADIQDLISETIITNELDTETITLKNINADTSGTINLLASTLNLNSNTIIGNVTISNTNGNITTNGQIKTSGTLNINDKLNITNTTLSSVAGFDIILSPSSNRVSKVSSTSAFIIPSGDTSQRPSLLAENGAIRFNTETQQYEGYSGNTSSWSSLGGVRDLDGNTYIVAEESVGSNDNTLWFYNDNINTVRFTPSHLDFRNVKSIRSSNVSAPQFVDWTANTPVTLGQFLKYKNNLYEVTYSGTTGTSGSEPVHTSGALANGSAVLTWSQLAVSALTFEDIEVLRIGPLGGLPLSINNDLRLANNVVSTDISDLIIRPNSGKKVIIDSPTTLVLPSGADADRGVPSRGSVRFSTTTSQFEGYDGTNWGSLGGVKDVDQNTYIIPELSPGTNENILYFYNDNNNTLQLSTTSLDFYSVDTIRSVTSDELEITASLLTFDNGASTFDNTATDRTFLYTTKQYFDLGLSAGLTSDTVLRLDDQGDVYLNVGFGTGVYNGVKVLDGDLKEFELADIKILTEKLTLVKGTSDNGSSIIYAVASHTGGKTTIVAENSTSGDKEFIEFGVLDDGTDVFHTEYGNIRTGTQLIVPTFEITGAGDVIINISLGSGVNPTEAVNITVVSNITKK